MSAAVTKEAKPETNTNGSFEFGKIAGALGAIQLKPQPTTSIGYILAVIKPYECIITPFPFISDFDVKTRERSQQNADIKISMTSVVSLIGNMWTTAFGDSVSIGRIGAPDPKNVQLKVFLSRAENRREYVPGVPFGAPADEASTKKFRHWLQQILMKETKAKDALFTYVPSGSI
jgi:hypothetical protein